MLDQEFLEKLKRHPELLSRMKNLLNIVEGEGELDIPRANDAEYAVIENMRGLGKELLQSWGKTQVAKSTKKFKAKMQKAKVHSKKN